jgi:KDO2-lipid IV(A) lauroyltransferase
VRHLLLYLLLLAVTGPVALLPYGLSVRLGELLGLAAHRLWPSRRQVALENVRLAMDKGAIAAEMSAEELVRENFRHLGRSVAEIVKINFGLIAPVLKRIRVEGRENVERAIAKGRGVIIVGGHCGNWELNPVFPMFFPCTFHLVARKQSNPYIDRMIARTRKRLGTRLLYKHGALRAFLGALKRGEVVGVAIDQSMQSEGVLIDFLGSPAWTIRMPAVLAKRTGAAVVPCFNRREPDGSYVLYALPEVELTGEELEDTRRMTAPIEDYIRENPVQWLWIHRRWKRAGEPEGG